jgi:hypothetical protein
LKARFDSFVSSVASFVKEQENRNSLQKTDRRRPQLIEKFSREIRDESRTRNIEEILAVELNVERIYR